MPAPKRTTLVNTPLVLLPGTGCNARLWVRLLPVLEGVATPVMPNLLACSSQEEMLDQLNKLPYKTFNLLGFSMGGYLAQRFFLAHPTRISKLALFCTSGDAKQNTPEFVERSLEKLKSEAYLQNMIKMDRPAAERQVIFEQLTTMLSEVGTSTIRRQMLATQQRHASLPFFKRPFPSILVAGAKDDKVVPISQINKLAQALETEAKWLDCGHMAPLETPEEFNRLVLSWLRPCLPVVK